jgi:hypothetical protein
MFRADKSFVKQVINKNRTRQCQRHSRSAKVKCHALHTAVLLTPRIYKLQQAYTICAPRAANGNRNIFSDQGRSAQLPSGARKNHLSTMIEYNRTCHWYRSAHYLQFLSFLPTKYTLNPNYGFYAVRMKCNQFTTQVRVLIFVSLQPINSDWLWKGNGKLLNEHLR